MKGLVAGARPLGHQASLPDTDRRRSPFASEIKALLVDPAMHREIDPLGYVSADVVEPDFEPTALVGVEQLGAGRALRIDAQGETLTRYWRYVPSCALEPIDGDAG